MSTRTPSLAAVAAVLMTLPALAACGGAAKGPNAASAAGARAAGTPVRGGTIRYGHEQEPPCLTGGWVQEAYIDRQLLDSLVAADAGGKVVPWLAQSWTHSDDQKTWTFKLKPGVAFTDGTPLDARAV